MDRHGDDLEDLFTKISVAQTVLNCQAFRNRLVYKELLEKEEETLRKIQLRKAEVEELHQKNFYEESVECKLRPDISDLRTSIDRNGTCAREMARQIDAKVEELEKLVDELRINLEKHESVWNRYKAAYESSPHYVKFKTDETQLEIVRIDQKYEQFKQEELEKQNRMFENIQKRRMNVAIVELVELVQMSRSIQRMKSEKSNELRLKKKQLSMLKKKQSRCVLPEDSQKDASAKKEDKRDPDDDKENCPPSVAKLPDFLKYRYSSVCKNDSDKKTTAFDSLSRLRSILGESQSWRNSISSYLPNKGRESPKIRGVSLDVKSPGYSGAGSSVSFSFKKPVPPAYRTLTTTKNQFQPAGGMELATQKEPPKFANRIPTNKGEQVLRANKSSMISDELISPKESVSSAMVRKEVDLSANGTEMMKKSVLATNKLLMVRKELVQPVDATQVTPIRKVAFSDNHTYYSPASDDDSPKSVITLNENDAMMETDANMECGNTVEGSDKSEMAMIEKLSDTNMIIGEADEAFDHSRHGESEMEVDSENDQDLGERIDEESQLTDSLASAPNRKIDESEASGSAENVLSFGDLVRSVPESKLVTVTAEVHAQKLEDTSVQPTMKSLAHKDFVSAFGRPRIEINTDNTLFGDSAKKISDTSIATQSITMKPSVSHDEKNLGFGMNNAEAPFSLKGKYDALSGFKPPQSAFGSSFAMCTNSFGSAEKPTMCAESGTNATAEINVLGQVGSSASSMANAFALTASSKAAIFGQAYSSTNASNIDKSHNITTDFASMAEQASSTNNEDKNKETSFAVVNSKAGVFDQAGSPFVTQTNSVGIPGKGKDCQGSIFSAPNSKASLFVQPGPSTGVRGQEVASKTTAFGNAGFGLSFNSFSQLGMVGQNSFGGMQIGSFGGLAQSQQPPLIAKEALRKICVDFGSATNSNCVPTLQRDISPGLDDTKSDYSDNMDNLAVNDLDSFDLDFSVEKFRGNFSSIFEDTPIPARSSIQIRKDNAREEDKGNKDISTSDPPKFFSFRSDNQPKRFFDFFD